MRRNKKEILYDGSAYFTISNDMKTTKWIQMDFSKNVLRSE